MSGCKNNDAVLENTVAITEEYVQQLYNTIRHNWTNISFLTMVVLAYCFALRTQDYCVTASSPTLEWSHVTFDHKVKGLTIKIDKAKHNQNGPPEYLTFYCPCSDKNHSVCAYCTLKKYKEKAQIRCPEQTAVFTKQNRYGKYRPFCYNRFLELFKENFKKVFGNKYSSKKHRPHGLRYGRATDLAKLGVPESTIRKITRHAAQSKTLFRYINMSSTQAAESILEFKKLNKALKTNKLGK